MAQPGSDLVQPNRAHILHRSLPRLLKIQDAVNLTKMQFVPLVLTALIAAFPASGSPITDSPVAGSTTSDIFPPSGSESLHDSTYLIYVVSG